MHVLAFAASNSPYSINHKVLSYTASLFTKDINPQATIEVLDFNSYEVPFYRPDRENKDGVPAKIQELYEKISKADAIIISFAEHNGNFTAVYKNAFDWLTRIDIKVYQDKPMLIMATSPGPRGGSNVLATAERGAQIFGMNIKARVSFPSFDDNFDTNTNVVTNSALDTEIRKALKALIS